MLMAYVRRVASWIRRSGPPDNPDDSAPAPATRARVIRTLRRAGARPSRAMAVDRVAGRAGGSSVPTR